MEILYIRQEFIKEQLSKDHELLGELEDALRTADDPKRKTKLRADIAEINEIIVRRFSELENLVNKNLNHSPATQPAVTTASAVQERFTPIQSPSRKTAGKLIEEQVGNRQIIQSIARLTESVEQEDSDEEAINREVSDDFYLLRLQLLVSAKLASHVPSSMLRTLKLIG